MKLSDVLNQIKDQQGLKTNRALADFLGIDERRVPEYYKGREPMDDDYALIAMASGRRVDELQTMVKLATAKDEKTRRVWSDYYKSIGGIAASFAMVVFAACILIVTPTTAKASIQAVCAPTHFVLCQLLMLTAYLKRKLQLRQIRLKPRLCISVL